MGDLWNDVRFVAVLSVLLLVVALIVVAVRMGISLADVLLLASVPAYAIARSARSDGVWTLAVVVVGVGALVLKTVRVRGGRNGGGSPADDPATAEGAPEALAPPSGRRGAAEAG